MLLVAQNGLRFLLSPAAVCSFAGIWSCLCGGVSWGYVTLQLECDGLPGSAEPGAFLQSV